MFNWFQGMQLSFSKRAIPRKNATALTCPNPSESAPKKTRSPASGTESSCLARIRAQLLLIASKSRATDSKGFIFQNYRFLLLDCFAQRTCPTRQSFDWHSLWSAWSKEKMVWPVWIDESTQRTEMHLWVKNRLDSLTDALESPRITKVDATFGLMAKLK